ncbi:MAG: alpha-2-macroglobulin [Magnetospirillum sp.]|nr:alpha-2-macroglobulin [Magnetospirillum sp.]
MALARFPRLLALLALVLALAAPVAAAAADTVRRPAGAALVPDRFLRSWDPVTIFFESDAGPAKGGPEDRPERLVTMTPAHPGAFTWLDSRTLQFRPAVAWPPMGRFQFQVQGRTSELTTLMAGLQTSQPQDGQENLDPVQAITLRFRDPIDPEVLARLVTIEQRPAPGIGSEGTRTLDRRDFEVKVTERTRPGDPAAYVLNLRHPIPWGMRAVLRLRLAPDESGHEEQRLSFATAAPFHAVRFGCPGERYPATPEGASYARERALRCKADERAIHVSFSQALKVPSAVEARNLVRLSPQVEDLRFETVGDTLVVRGRFVADTLYHVRLEPAAIEDVKGRRLEMKAASQLYLSFPGRAGFVRWQAGEGIAERFGPQMVPLKARGVERVDMRIHPIDPLDRSLWPFPASLSTDDTRRPPGPGEEPEAYSKRHPASSDTIARHVAAFGSPSVSQLVKLDLPQGDASASLGLNLRPHLTRIAGENRPGHYLIGIRRLDSQGERNWMRLQVTDLSLTAVEETDRVRFAVTSLSTGLPVDKATIRLEGEVKGGWGTLAEMVTDATGMAEWNAPGSEGNQGLRRLVVEKGEDRLVLDPAKPPRVYGEGGWRDPDYYNWLHWATRSLAGREIPPAELCHIFTERPIYRPDDSVHIKGYMRHWEAGKLALSKDPATLVVAGPGGAEWRYPVTLNEFGSFYHKFDAKTAATGTYKAWLEHKATPSPSMSTREEDGEDEPASEDSPEGGETAEPGAPARACHVARFKKEAYRLPRFEVQLHAPQSAGLDAPFKVALTAEYYAGGLVADRPVRWRVTQVPFNWVPKAKAGYVFSADSRFSSSQGFRASPVLEREAKTDVQGGAALTLDPTIEPTAQPRKYVVEATVVGDDDQTVTNTHEVLALPPFVLGLKVPRFLEKADRIEPLIAVEDAQGKAMAGQKVTVRLMRRQWNSILQATDFTQGSAKYVTEVIEEKVAETTFTSGSAPEKVSFPIKGAGVFIIEVDAQDKLGRLQTVKVDLFAGGERPATWSRPPAEVFSATPDKTAYAPGETAKIVLQSPFQTAQALAVIEDPSGHNHYEWVSVKNGYGTFAMPIKREYLPRVPVHFVLMRGRIKGDDDQVTSHADLRKPATLAATQWVTVTPAKHTAKVELDYPRKAQPGQTVEITVRLNDDQGKPLAGEATLWMVDQAVLALAKEARLDPLPQFIVNRESRTLLRDTRNMAFGLLPLQEEPGGDEGDDGSPLERVTVRKNFTPVPLYEPSLQIGPDGIARVKVTLPDSLTNFKLRAKAVSGPSRFGYGTGDMQVRLPVLVQPALPRFLRPGDSFELAAIGRVVDGKDGPGRAQVRLKGLELSGSDQRGIDWRPNAPVRLAFPVTVPANGGNQVEITLAVDRTVDGAKDAFQVALPVLPDRDPVVARAVAALSGTEPVVLPAVAEPIRPGTLERRVLIASRELAALAGGLDYLRAYPFGCTEQRISQLRANVAGKRFGEALMGRDAQGDRLIESFRATQEWIASAMGDNGLVAYWPGGRGYVAVTAWAVQLLVEAKAANLPVDDALLGKLTLALKQSLRSDYRDFVDGNGPAERSWALAALTAAGQGDPAYAAELARKSPFLSAENVAQVAWALARSSATPASTKAELHKRLWGTVITKLDHGRKVYGGLQENGAPSPLILPSETRAVAQVLRASLAGQRDEPRNRLLADALLGLGGGDGWGSTNANAEAMLALVDWVASAPKGPDRTVTVAFGADRRTLALPGGVPLAQATSSGPAEVAVSLVQPSSEPLAVWSRTSYLPQADGAQVASAARGFAVDREQWKVPSDGSAPTRMGLEKPATTITLQVGDVVEDHVVVVNQTDRAHVAIVLPLAAGMEPLNPRLATASPEAKPSQPPTRAPTYVAYMDDNVAWFYDELPKGTYHVHVRSRATVPGRFIQPPAAAKAMYDDTVNGNGNGAVVVVTRP